MTFIEMITLMGTKLADASHIQWALAVKKLNLNAAYTDLYFRIAEYQPNLYTKAAADITIEADVDDYNLPSDFGKLYRYKYATDEHWRYFMHRRGHGHYYYDHSSVSIKGAHGIIAGVEQFAQIHVHHNPTAGAVLEVEYIPSPPALTADTDIFPIDPLWHELVVLKGCVRCAETKIDDSRYARLAQREQEQMARFSIWLSSRSHETDGRFSDHFGDD